jgi:hypothetical protein
MTRFFITQCYYLITKDLELQYSSSSHIYNVLFHPCVKVIYEILSFQIINIHCWSQNGDYMLLPFIIILLVITMHI